MKEKITFLIGFVSLITVSFSRHTEYCTPFSNPRYGTRTFYSTYYITQCNEGYILTGDSNITCVNGRWASTPPVCTKGCKQLPEPPNGYIKCDAEPLTVGKICFFGCNAGYKLEGPRKRQCYINSRWTGYATKCVLDENTAEIGRTCSVENGGCSHYCRPSHTYGVICTCADGYYLMSDQKTCNVIERTCAVDNGGCSHFCHPSSTAGVKCTCASGYSLMPDQKTCRDIDECHEENRCTFKCHNIPGGYYCSCPPGYKQLDKYTCQGCDQDSYWSVNFNGCARCPENAHTKSAGMNYISDCVCKPGFRGHPERGYQCEDINECAENNFGCSYQCVNTMGDAYCLCERGFELREDNKTCVDTDECKIKNGGCHFNCVNTQGSFECRCPKGYIVSPTDAYSCIDIDECADNNGGCEHECVNHPGGFSCQCRNGYLLTRGMKRCTKIHCPRVPKPLYSNMKCKDSNGIKIRNEDGTEDYPLGSVCEFKCNTGFKSTLKNNKIVCKEDGSWEGEVPQCISQLCSPLEVPKNGEVHPPTCSKEGAPVKSRCTFTCQPGYKMMGKSIFICQNSLNWSHSEIPHCEPVSLTAHPKISCDKDVFIDLENGLDSVNVTIPEPETNMETYHVHPEWVVMGQPTKFPAGKTDVTFRATNAANVTAECYITIHVFDKEPPAFINCPKSFEVENATSYGVAITWETPEATDNVGIATIVQNVDPNTTLSPGVHSIVYVATDAAGNVAKCSFQVKITRKSCDDLANPKNGEANCVEWTFGKLCTPFCEEGYMRHPDEPPFFSCIDPGPWQPSDAISDCLAYSAAVSSQCGPRSEFRFLNSTNEEICLECPEGTELSPVTETCEEIET